jgi:hypothetical protein
VILGGQQEFLIKEKHIVEHLIMFLLKFYKENNMIKQWIYGV